MQKTTLKDFKALLDLYKEYDHETAFEKILNSGQRSYFGMLRTSKDEASGYHLLYSHYFIYDSSSNNVSIDNSYYDQLSDRQKNQLINYELSVLKRCKEFEWSKGHTAFSTITPPIAGIENLIGIAVIMGIYGGEENLPIKSYSFCDTNFDSCFSGE